MNVLKLIAKGRVEPIFKSGDRDSHLVGWRRKDGREMMCKQPRRVTDAEMDWWYEKKTWPPQIIQVPGSAEEKEARAMASKMAHNAAQAPKQAVQPTPPTREQLVRRMWLMAIFRSTRIIDGSRLVTLQTGAHVGFAIGLKKVQGKTLARDVKLNKTGRAMFAAERQRIEAMSEWKHAEKVTETMEDQNQYRGLPHAMRDVAQQAAAPQRNPKWEELGEKADTYPFSTIYRRKVAS